VTTDTTTSNAEADAAPLGVLLAGGGSGGHIFPAVAIAEQIRDLEPRVLCRYMVSDRPLDSEILRGLGESFAPIPARPPGVRPRALLKFITSWGGAVRASRAAVREMQRSADRVVMVATGGFVSAPAAQAARAEGAPVVLVNLDASPGKASRFVARFARERFTPDGGAPEAWTRIPPVVRRAALADGPASACRERLELNPSMRTLFVTGASQGASSINRLLEAMLEKHRNTFEGWQVVHQTGGGEEAARVRASYEKAGVPARVEAFFTQMADCWGAADLAVSRAGAGSVGEAWANGVPTVFLPYPHHRDEHQRLNALPLERAGGALIVRDEVDPSKNLAGAGEHLASLLTDKASREARRGAMATLGPADGAARVASFVRSLDQPGGRA